MKSRGLERTVVPEHLLVWARAYEAPSSDALREFSVETEIVSWMAWNTSETELAMSLEESLKLLR